MDPNNWKLDANACQNTAKNVTGLKCNKDSDGGFFPYGFKGVMRGAATCFYSFIGYVCKIYNFCLFNCL